MKDTNGKTDGFIRDIENRFLDGPRPRLTELKFVLSVARELIKAFRIFHFVGPCVTVFGSARFKEDHPYYIMARALSASIANKGITIMTGGGPGIMEAANRGAKDVNGKSIGANIVLPHEQFVNAYMDKYVIINQFFVRKFILRKYSLAFVVMPGGFGTLDEFFETLTLIQTSKIEQFPMVVMGLAFHQHLIKHIESMVEQKTISAHDLDLILFTDSIDEAVNHILKYIEIRAKSMIDHPPKPIGVLGEHNL